MANPGTLTDRPGLSPVIDGLFKSDRPRTIDRYINYFGSDGDFAGEERKFDAVDAEERTA